MVNVAANFYKATLAVTSGLSAPYNNLATIYKQQVLYGFYDEPIPEFIHPSKDDEQSRNVL